MNNKLCQACTRPFSTVGPDDTCSACLILFSEVQAVKKIRHHARCCRGCERALEGKRRTWCDDCAKEARFVYYGLSEAEYQQMIEDQGGRCKICGTIDPKTKSGVWCIDHKHVPGFDNMTPAERRVYVRGLLCSRCNHGLGVFDDNIARLRSAIEYIRDHNSVLASVPGYKLTLEGR